MARKRTRSQSEDNVAGARRIVDAYSNELQANLDILRTVTHRGGEIGRVHEEFLRSVFERLWK